MENRLVVVTGEGSRVGKQVKGIKRYNVQFRINKSWG